MDEELREAERRGDAARADALRRRTGLLGVPPELPDLLVALDEAELAYDAADLGGEFSPDPRGGFRAEVARCLDSVLACIHAAGLDVDEALLRVVERSPAPQARGRASQLLCARPGLPEVALRRLVASPFPEVQGPAARQAMTEPPPRAGRGPWTGPPAWMAGAVRDALGAAAPGADRAPLLEQLGALDPSGSAELFAAHLEDGHPHVAWRACEGLVLARDLRAWPALERLLDHPGPTVVAWALEAMGVLDLSRAAAAAAARLRGGRVDLPPEPRWHEPDGFCVALRLLLDVADARCWAHLVEAARRGRGPRAEWARHVLARQAKDGVTEEADLARPEVAERLRRAGRLRAERALLRADAYRLLRELADAPRRAVPPGLGR